MAVHHTLYLGIGPVALEVQCLLGRRRPFTLEGVATIATPRYDRAQLAAPVIISGPAIIEDDWSTIVVPPGWRAAPDAQGHIVMTQEAA